VRGKETSHLARTWKKAIRRRTVARVIKNSLATIDTKRLGALRLSWSFGFSFHADEHELRKQSLICAGMVSLCVKRAGFSMVAIGYLNVSSSQLKASNVQEPLKPDRARYEQGSSRPRKGHVEQVASVSPPLPLRPPATIERRRDRSIRSCQGLTIVARLMTERAESRISRPPPGATGWQIEIWSVSGFDLLSPVKNPARQASFLGAGALGPVEWGWVRGERTKQDDFVGKNSSSTCCASHAADALTSSLSTLERSKSLAEDH